MNIGGLEIQYNVSPFLATPRVVALLFAGAAGYVGFIDPKARENLKTTPQKLHQWTGMYKNSMPVMGGLALLGAGLSGLCYWKSKEYLWLVGGALMGSLWPYTLLTMMPMNKELMKIDENIEQGAELSSEEEKNVVGKLKSWLNRHRIRVLISAAAAGIFYVAELYSAHDFSVTIGKK